MEADLSRFHNIDYRDRWRFDAQGRRRLTLRMIWVRVKHLPTDSAVAQVLRGDDVDWRVEHQLFDEMRMTLQAAHGVRDPKPHPLRPKPGPAPDSPNRRKRLAAARRRQAERKRRFGEGGT